MREISQDVNYTKKLVKRITGVNIKIKVNRGRNRTEYMCGAVENTYPMIFTFRKDNGELNSFSYSDILSNNVKFFKR
ncbi:MAG: Veg family protein [Christensenellales bacterium]